MNIIKKGLLMNWYRLLLKRNHAKYWIEDHPEESAHKVMEKADNAYWNVFMRMISVVLILSFIPMVQAVPQIVITYPTNTTYTATVPTDLNVSYNISAENGTAVYSLNGAANVSIWRTEGTYLTSQSLSELSISGEGGGCGIADNSTHLFITKTLGGSLNPSKGGVIVYSLNDYTATYERSINTSLNNLNYTWDIAYSDGRLYMSHWNAISGGDKVWVWHENGTFNTTYDPAHDVVGVCAVDGESTFYTLDEGTNSYIHEHHLNNGSLTGINYSITDIDDPTMTCDSSFFWVLETGDDDFYKYYRNGTSAKNFTTTDINRISGGIHKKGSYIFAMDFDGVSDWSLFTYYANTFINTTFTALQGSNTIEVYANDTAWNSSTLIFYVDTEAPVTSNPIYPSSHPEASSLTIYIDVTDTTAVNVTLLDIFGSNRTMTASGDTYSVTVTTPFVTSNTLYTLTYYYNDTYGHAGSESYDFYVNEVAGGGGDTGGAATPIIPDCGDFLVAYYGRIEIGGTPKVLSPPVTVPINNGNQTQNIFVKFDYELQSYCKLTDGPENPVYAGAQTSFTFDCRIPEEQIDGNVIIFLSEECQQAIPVSLLPDQTFMSNLGSLIYLVLSGDLDAFRISYHGVPMAIIVTIIIVFISFIIWW